MSAARSMSISLVTKKCGTGPSEVTSRRAIVRRISLIGSSRYADGPWTAPGSACRGNASGRSEGFADGAPFELMADSTSLLIILPPGPLPFRDDRLIPASAAMRAAIGEIKVRPEGAAASGHLLPSPLTGGAGADSFGLASTAGVAAPH